MASCILFFFLLDIVAQGVPGSSPLFFDALKQVKPNDDGADGFHFVEVNVDNGVCSIKDCMIFPLDGQFVDISVEGAMVVCAMGFHADFQKNAFGAADVANLHALPQRVLVPCLAVLVPVVGWGFGCERFAPPFHLDGDDAHIAKHVFSCSVAHH